MDQTHDDIPKIALKWHRSGKGAALATVVGVLIEVPVMLSVVRIVNATRPWYERGAQRPGAIPDEA